MEQLANPKGYSGLKTRSNRACFYNINVLSSDGVIACGMGSGTASEVALALKSNKPVILLNCDRPTQLFFQQLSADRVWISDQVDGAMQTLKLILNL